MFISFTPLQIRIDFPALDAIVAYLKDARAQQAQIDALTSEVRTLTAGMAKSNTDLETAVANQK